MAVAGRNSKGQVTINGVPRFILGLYDSGFHGVNASDMAGHIANHTLSRFKDKINVYLHMMSGTVDNTLRLCDLLDPLNMHVIAVGNSHMKATAEQMSNGTFQVTCSAQIISALVCMRVCD